MPRKQRLGDRTPLLRSLCLLSGLLVVSGCGEPESVSPRAGSPKSPRPNILLLLADDLGNNDLGISNDHPANLTPNMDDLARAGTRFTRFYTENTCAPSRAALLTGRYAARAGFRPVARGIPPEITTLPEALRKDGYATHHVGKWHLGSTVKTAFPLAQGFDTSFGFLNQWSLRKPGPLGGYSFPTYLDPWLKVNDQPREAFRGHLTDILADHTIQLIKQADSTRPWFIYHAFFAPHTPIEPAERFSEQFPDTPAGRFRALLKQLDSSVGRILESLRETDQFDNTIVILASDNGGTNQSVDNNYPYYGTKATYWEGGVRVPLIIHWPQRFAPGTTFGQPVAIFDLYPTLLDLISSSGSTTDLDGVSLARAQQQEELLRRDLFWESFIFNHAVYAVLTPNNERLVHGRAGGEHLLDLTEDPFGDPKNAVENPALSDRIRSRYEAWRRTTRRVDTSWTPSDPQGHGILSGDDFQRSPGMGGYTFAIGITPAKQINPIDDLQVIAQQLGLLTISLERNTTISVEIDGQKLRSQPIAPERCHSIVISTFFYRQLSPIAAKHRRLPILNLYIDGKLSDQKRSERSLPSGAALGEPTFIGQDAKGRRRFRGQLSPPQVYNQAMVQQGDMSFPGIEEIHPSVCPQ